MKVYSWKTLLAIILAGGVFVILNFEDLMAGEVSAYVLMIWFGYLILKGLWVSFTKEGFEEDERSAARIKMIYRKIFGRGALIAPWGHVILIILAAVSVQIMPNQKWLPTLLIIGSLVYIITVGRLLKKHLKMEEEIDNKEIEKL